MQDFQSDLVPKDIRPIDVITQTSQKLIEVEEKYGIEARIASFSFHLGNDGTPRTMSLSIDGADLISSKIPMQIQNWSPVKVARTVWPPIFFLLAK